MTQEQRIRIALTDLCNIANSRQLLKGHFGLVAKRHAVKVSELKEAYNSNLNNNIRSN